VNQQANFVLSPHHTALRCLFVVSLQRGVLLKPENFSDFRETDTTGSVLRVMNAVGLQGKVLSRCKWKNIVALNDAYPLMAIQKGGVLGNRY
jgi:subfamily B ATP-binding cassette protein HlyB/CyaB